MFVCLDISSRIHIMCANILVLAHTDRPSSSSIPLHKILAPWFSWVVHWYGYRLCVASGLVQLHHLEERLETVCRDCSASIRRSNKANNSRLERSSEVYLARKLSERRGYGARNSYRDCLGYACYRGGGPLKAATTTGGIPINHNNLLNGTIDCAKSF